MMGVITSLNILWKLCDQTSGHIFDFVFPPLTSDTRSLDVISIVTSLEIDDPELESGQGQGILPWSKTSRTPSLLFGGYRSSLSGI